MWLPFRKPPYRWLRRTAWHNVSCMWYDVTQGPRNVWRWLPVIWYDADYDHSFLIDILQYKFKRMAEYQVHNKIVTSWPRKARQLYICQELCKRLNEDNYLDNAHLVYHVNPSDSEQAKRAKTKAAIYEAVSVQSNDQALLGRMIGKHLISWWD